MSRNADVYMWDNDLSRGYRCIGIIPVAIGEDIVLTTQLSVHQDHDIADIGGTKIVSSQSINGSMLVFSKPKFGDVYGNEKDVNMTWIANDYTFTMENTHFTTRRPMPDYESCDAAFVEWVAEDAQITVMAKELNTTITI